MILLQKTEQGKPSVHRAVRTMPRWSRTGVRSGTRSHAQGDHGQQGPSAAELNDSYVGSVESPDNLLKLPTGITPEFLSEEVRTRPEKQFEKKKNKKRMTSLSSPRYTLSMSENQGRDNLYIEGWNTDKSYLVPADTGESHHRRTARERPDCTVSPAEGVR